MTEEQQLQLQTLQTQADAANSELTAAIDSLPIESEAKLSVLAKLDASKEAGHNLFEWLFSLLPSKEESKEETAVDGLEHSIGKLQELNKSKKQ